MLSFNNSSFSSITNTLVKLGNELALSNKRLSTGYKVNTASDDPAGIIAATKMSAEIARLESTISNGERISSVIDTADGAMAEISSLLTDIETNMLAAADGTATADEKAAYQAEIDMAITSIDRLVNTTAFNGTKLLDGTVGYTTSVGNGSYITDVNIKSASTSSGSITLDIEAPSAVTEAARITSDPFATQAGGGSFTLTGNDGSATITWNAGATRAEITQLINDETGNTGIVATDTGTEIHMDSSDVGEDQSVSLNVTSGSFAMATATSDTGVGHTDVEVEGLSTQMDGNMVYFNYNGSSGSFEATDAFLASGATTTITISGDGTNWALDSSSTGAINFGQRSLASSGLGSTLTGYLSSLQSGGDNDVSSGNFTTAASIIDLAQQQVVTDRARWGATKSYTVDTYLNSLEDAKEAMTAARSSIIDLDYAEETANNERLQLLMEMGTTVLAAMKENASNVLSLLTPIS